MRAAALALLIAIAPSPAGAQSQAPGLELLPDYRRALALKRAGLATLIVGGVTLVGGIGAFSFSGIDADTTRCGLGPCLNRTTVEIGAGLLIGGIVHVIAGAIVASVGITRIEALRRARVSPLLLPGGAALQFACDLP